MTYLDATAEGMHQYLESLFLIPHSIYLIINMYINIKNPNIYYKQLLNATIHTYDQTQTFERKTIFDGRYFSSQTILNKLKLNILKIVLMTQSVGGVEKPPTKYYVSIENFLIKCCSFSLDGIPQTFFGLH